MSQKVKIRLPSGDLAVYLVASDLAGYDNIRKQGKQVARQLGGRWYQVGFGQIRDRLYDEAMREAEALPLSFDVPHPMWGLQVQLPVAPGQLEREWRWVVGPNGPYQYHTEEEAYQILRLCYPEGMMGEDIRIQSF